ncbi:polyprenyl synthetase family protein [Cellulomonas shaoxiangyii]|uniref:Polyprenyl synthetase family protein n=1 Tax=Cellulomonas shaoxiangyii TaxID=2566013 RepID=A0A4V1CMM0_9CELL|nr:polyprenyl synthetase family protein [Cellulomonas shaoxiangyii]QCB93415.1 polyprenyl synthetase family protein [Cellulomonas shaoxiangyii]TGY84652.1 polyprenyl synthetase family protein [Cellulomonas shaoxiangyii]
MTDAPPHVDLVDLRAGVDAALAGHVARLRIEVASLSPDAAPLVDAVERMVAGGKRLRAAFCYWSWRAHGGTPGTPQESAVLRVGAALELFQAAALFHDDVMDDSDTRRGLPAAHRVFAGDHTARSLLGDGERFGSAAAILLGDLALVASEREWAEAVGPLPDDVATTARTVFDRMRTEVTVGQFLDVLAQALPWGDDDGDERRALDVLRTKSARYSVEHPIVLGAALAGADESALAGCREVGLPLGEAFQLRDDLLGVFGDPATTGKPAGDDLREGKRTVLVARALRNARAAGDDATVHALTSGLGDRTLSDERVRSLAATITATGAPTEVEQLIDDLTARAFAALDARGWPEPARGQLLALARAAVDRRA